MNGAVLNAEQLRPYYGDPRVLGLAELMNAYERVRCDPKILRRSATAPKRERSWMAMHRS